MATQYYNLPTITQNAVANIPDDMNGLANAVDYALHTVAGSVPDVGTLTLQINNAQQTAANALNKSTTNEGKIATAEAEIVTAKGNIQTLQGNVAEVSNTATTAQITANSAQSMATANTNKIEAIKEFFTLSSFEKKTSLPGTSGLDVLLTLAKNSDGSLFKFYGTIACASGSFSGQRTQVPGGSGAFAYGIPTGLYVSAPENAYLISLVGTQYIFQSAWNNVTNLGAADLAIGTNGQLYIAPSSNSSSWASNEILYIIFNPCLYFNGSFGDTPTPVNA